MGPLDVPEEEKITRTIAVDRTRKIKFKFVKKEERKEDKDKEETGSEQEDEESKLRGLNESLKGSNE
jgi:hypothetical protein